MAVNSIKGGRIHAELLSMAWRREHARKHVRFEDYHKVLATIMVYAMTKIEVSAASKVGTRMDLKNIMH